MILAQGRPVLSYHSLIPSLQILSRWFCLSETSKNPFQQTLLKKQGMNSMSNLISDQKCFMTIMNFLAYIWLLRYQKSSQKVLRVAEWAGLRCSSPKCRCVHVFCLLVSISLWLFCCRKGDPFQGLRVGFCMTQK